MHAKLTQKTESDLPDLLEFVLWDAHARVLHLHSHVLCPPPDVTLSSVSSACLSVVSKPVSHA